MREQESESVTVMQVEGRKVSFGRQSVVIVQLLLVYFVGSCQFSSFQNVNGHLMSCASFPCSHKS